MSLAEEMLATMSESDDFVSYLADKEGHIVINESRQAIVPAELKTIAVTGDKDIETVTFDCVRYWDGHDLSTFAIYLNYVLPDKTEGTYIPKAITTSDGEDVFHFDWEIKNNITEKSGKISFAVTAVKTKQNENGETVVDKQWSSLPNGDCSIALGLGISNVPDEEESSDVVAQLSAILEKIHGDVDEWIKTVVVQTTGDSETAVMSQKATTRNISMRKSLLDVEGANANNIVENGYYFFGSSDVVYNVPENAGVVVAFIDYLGSAYRNYQLFVGFTKNMYVRCKMGNVWNAWLRIATTSDIPSVPVNLLTLRNDLTNENLNDVVTSGYYFAGSGVTVTNYPNGESGRSFMLLVFGGDEIARRYQIYFSYDNSRMYLRRQAYNPSVNTWSEWSKIAHTSDIPTITKDLSIQKDSAGSFKISFGKYTCKFKRFVSEPRNADLYDLYDIYCGDTMITNGNIMGVLKEDGQADFMGGIDHGDERDYTLSIKCDSSNYDIESGSLTSCNKIEINYTSKLYRVSDGTHVYNKIVRLNITKDKIVVYNDCECVVDDSVLVNAYNGGLVDCQFPHLIGAVMDNLYSFPAPTTHPSNDSHGNINSILYWTDGAVRLINITGHQKNTYKGRLVAYKNPDGTPQRNKIYYDIVGETATPVANGEHIVGEYEMVFE